MLFWKELKMEQREFNDICFITESGTQIGYGHLYRSIALAKEFSQRGFRVDFVINDENGEKIISDHLIDIHVREMSSVVKDISLFRYVFLDVFKSSWIKYKDFIEDNSTKTKFVSIIDTAFLDSAIDTDYIFAIGLRNYNFREELLHRNDKEIKLYSGNDFFIFREEFNEVSPPIIAANVERIFISMGGSDPADLTILVLEELQTITQKLQLDIVIGAGYGFERLERLKRKISNSKHTINLHVNISNIANLMQIADIALINGGNTRFELALIGIPFISIAINEKQKEISDSVAKQGIGVSLDVFDKLEVGKFEIVVNQIMSDFHKREMMSSNMKNIFTGKGAQLIYKTLFE